MTEKLVLVYSNFSSLLNGCRESKHRSISVNLKNGKMISEVLLLMITCILIPVSSTEVKWTVRGTSHQLGQGLTLFCKVVNCTVDGTKRWHGGPEDKVLMFHSGISTDKAKYSTLIEKNGFILTILNLAVEYLNVSYECSCGPECDKHILYKKDVFTDLITDAITEEESILNTSEKEDLSTVDNLNKTTNDTNYVGTHVARGVILYVYIAIPVILVILLIIVIVIKRRWLLRKLKEKIYDPRRRNSGSSLPIVNLSPIQCTEEDPLIQTTRVDSNARHSSGSSLPSVNSSPIQCTEENYGQTMTEPLTQTITIRVDSNARQSSDDNLHGNELLQQSQESINRVTAAESIEPSISREASSNIVEVKQIAVSTLPIERTSSLITGTEKRESHETNSRCLPSRPDTSLSYSINHIDDPAYADNKLRELSFKTCPLNKSTIVQLAEAGFSYSGDKNIAQCFSCENKIYCHEGQNPLDEAFHNNCEYLHKKTA